MNPTVTRLIGRETELNDIKENLSLLKENKPLPEPVWYVYGVPYVGKTSLLKNIQSLARERGIPTVYIDFDREKVDSKLIDARYEGDGGKVILVQEIMRQLTDWVDDSPPFRVQATDHPIEANRKLLQEFGRIHNVYRKPVVLLLDTMEDTEKETFNWVLTEIVQPIKDQRAFVVLTAKAHFTELDIDIDWKISRKMSVRKLEPLNYEQNQEHIRLLLENMPIGENWRFSDALPYTGGVPGLNEEVIKIRLENENEILKHMSDLIFKRIANRHVQKVREELLAMSAFRQFDNRLLANIVNALWPERHMEKSRRAGLELARQLQETTLLQAHQDGYGYVIEPDIRRILDAYQRSIEKNVHVHIHYLAYVWFGNEVKSGDDVALANQVYHLLAAWYDKRLNPTISLPDDLPDGTNRIEQLKSLVETGLKGLSDNPRAETMIGKIMLVLQEKEFLWFFENGENKERKILLDLCEDYRDGYVKEQTR